MPCRPGVSHITSLRRVAAPVGPVPAHPGGRASPLAVRRPGAPAHRQEAQPLGRGGARPGRRGPELRLRGRRGALREGRRPPRGPVRPRPRLPARTGVLGRRAPGRAGAAQGAGAGRPHAQRVGVDLRRRGPGPVAREGRIYVEGKHDAELVEKVWGHDLRIEGVVVEPLHGVDDLPGIVRDFRPSSGRRLGVLVDHLVTGSKESRIAAQVTGDHALVVGHPFIDIWQAVKPSVVGIKAWPVVPKGQPWKEGVCAALGWEDDTGYVWAQRILARVRTWTDLEPALIGRVEELIDFVTESP